MTLRWTVLATPPVFWGLERLKDNQAGHERVIEVEEYKSKMEVKKLKFYPPPVKEIVE